jgi:hypothetical protein
MTEEKRQEIKNLIDSRFEEDKTTLCRDIEQGYIFGTYAENEHYNIDDIVAIYNEVESEQNPPRDIETEDEEEN